MSAAAPSSPPWRPITIVNAYAAGGVGCLIEAQSRGLAVPGDLSVVGIDNLEMAAHLSPALTTIDVPTARIGAAAAQRVLDRLAGQKVVQIMRLPIELLVRRTSSPPRAD